MKSVRRSASRACAMATLVACGLAPHRSPAAENSGDASAPCTTQDAEVRRRPGQEPQSEATEPCDPNRMAIPHAQDLPPPTARPDRWRIVESLGYADNRLDPYSSNNPIKGDRPVYGNDGYTAFTATSSSLVEPRRVPLASGNEADQVFLSQTATFDMVIYKGDTVFRPPDYQLRITPVINYSQTRTSGAATGSTTVSAQSLFFEKHLRDESPHYDFDSVRVGIQPLTSDFRGFLMLDQPAGVRFFGTRSDNRYQYNVGWFRPLAKNAVRQNDLGASPPHEDVLLANLYRQDFLLAGFNAEIIAAHDRSRTPGTDRDVTYLGVSWDGHFSRVNLTGAAYAAGGRESPGTLTASDATTVRAYFAALELSVDFDWIRPRLSVLHASGDPHPEDRRATGFAALNGVPLFAGADSSFVLHQRLPLTASVDLKERDRIFADLRDGQGTGPPSFSGPGLQLVGLGMDFDLSSRLRLSLDANHIGFAETAPLEIITAKPSVPRALGNDFSLNAFFRPLNSQNVVLRFGAAILQPGAGYRALYGDGTPYFASFNLILTY